jgi:large subunit ribosomal protein L3
MTQLFDEKGDVVPVTVIEAGPCTVTEDPHRGARRLHRAPARLRHQQGEALHQARTSGQFTKRNLPPSRHLREFRIPDVTAFTLRPDAERVAVREG